MTPPASQQPLFAGATVLALGIDPGSRVTGWGLVRRNGRQLDRVESGELRPRAGASLEYRLAFIEDRLLRLIHEHRPDVVGLESQYVPRFRAGMTEDEAKRCAGQQRGALVISQARGAAAVAIGKVELRLGKALPLMELHASTVKATVCSGRAGKEQVQRAVQAILGLGCAPLGTDESDALAIAISATMGGEGAMTGKRKRVWAE